ncbi:hypothetical protein Ae717Ps2_6040 [Pseudonocardia sp. Ae717_Ps2]|nr:hypothetical protein Ae717Ps2_7169c [Pseudonocardia sp. Ae717_Ps2]OLM27947.1 hypothetical protein Ae717Ps2_6914c [Pseudonocardia sp. Ae717_Ps2]OLM27963.1 hypothetical protein Ae717Ps2_6930c [Pseudonocardia sp. Ae717_Ps2]OLM28700.1 hypothetical protein Ae717Ps2_6298c [Pseudonocardia sp. Ae717_Ps2]OLM28713.1 hypothetical protein Ae717Ps2_6311c [Pseudonocardia sp. Ae717_Ps2]
MVDGLIHQGATVHSVISQAVEPLLSADPGAVLVTLATRDRGKPSEQTAVIDHRMHHALRHHAGELGQPRDPDTGSPVERPLRDGLRRGIGGGVQSKFPATLPGAVLLVGRHAVVLGQVVPAVMTQQGPQRRQDGDRDPLGHAFAP